MSMTDTVKVASIIADAGGRVIGRTRLQKIAYLMCETGLETGFSFVYKHYGPFSDDLASSSRIANLLGEIREIERSTSWGGSYSEFTASVAGSANPIRKMFAQSSAAADAVELELAATAVFLAKAGFGDPWEETARRKPEKVDNGRLERAKDLLRALGKIPTPRPLPII